MDLHVCSHVMNVEPLPTDVSKKGLMGAAQSINQAQGTTYLRVTRFFIIGFLAGK